MPAIDIRSLTVEFEGDGYTHRPIDRLDASIADGSLALLLGPSGCGKTTLLSCIGGLRRPSSGGLRVDDLEVDRLSDHQLLDYRRRVVGYVFQSFNLIRSLDALDNVAAPLLSQGVRRRVARQRAEATLTRVGMADHVHKRPGQLSGGQQQRIAVARGLAHDPKLLLADEPTASLDYVQAQSIIALLRSLAAPGRTVVVSTHDDRLLPIADEVVRLSPVLDDESAEKPGLIELDEGGVLFAQGSLGSLVYVVESGAIEIVRAGKRVHVCHAGAYFGELGPMMHQPRSATARAIGPTVVRSMTIQEFRDHGRAAVADIDS